MSRADQTNIPERAWAATVFRNIWSSTIDPFPVRIMVTLDMSDFSGRIGASRWTIELLPVDDSMSRRELFI